MTGAGEGVLGSGSRSWPAGSSEVDVTNPTWRTMGSKRGRRGSMGGPPARELDLFLPIISIYRLRNKRCSRCSAQIHRNSTCVYDTPISSVVQMEADSAATHRERTEKKYPSPWKCRCNRTWIAQNRNCLEDQASWRLGTGEMTPRLDRLRSL